MKLPMKQPTWKILVESEVILWKVENQDKKILDDEIVQGRTQR